MILNEPKNIEEVKQVMLRKKQIEEQKQITQDLLRSIREKNNIIREEGFPEVNVDKFFKDWQAFLSENDAMKNHVN